MIVREDSAPCPERLLLPMFAGRGRDDGGGIATASEVGKLEADRAASLAATIAYQLMPEWSARTEKIPDGLCPTLVAKSPDDA